MEGRPFLGLRGNALTTLIVFVAGMEFLLFGYDQGVVGGILTLPSFTNTFPSLCNTSVCLKGMTSVQKSQRSTIQGVVVASYNLGCLVGAMSTFKVGNALGRRKTIFIGCIVVSTGAILQASAFSLPQFVVGRVICGIGTGMNTATMPIWQSECTKPHQRGPILAFETSLVPAGVMISYWVDFGLSYAEPSQVAWRFPVALQLVFASFVLAFILLLPESPRWLVLKEQYEQATQVLSILHDASPTSEVVTEHLNAIRAAVHSDNAAGWKAVLSQGDLKNRTRTILAVGIQVMSQFTGINVLTFYATSIFQNEIGLSPFMSRILSGCLGTDSFISGMVSIAVIRNFPRRQVAMFNLTGMTFSMIVLAISRKFQGHAMGIVATVFMFVFKTFFALGFAQIPWIYPAEITPLTIRVQSNAMSTAANWVCVFAVVMIAPIAFQNIGWKTYLIFAVCNVAALVVVYLFYPETRNRSLEEIDLIFKASSGPFGAVKEARLLRPHFDHRGEPIISLEADIKGIEDRNDATAHIERAVKLPRREFRAR